MGRFPILSTMSKLRRELAIGLRQACPCGYAGDDLERHYRNSPSCRVAAAGASSARDSDTSFNHFAERTRSFMASEIWDAHTKRFVRIQHTEVMRMMTMSIVTFVLGFITMELSTEAESPQGLTIESAVALCGRITKLFQMLPTARSMIDQQKRRYLQVQPLDRGVGDQAKKAVSFSIIQLLIVMLNDSKIIRQHVIAASDLWKTGKLYEQVPRPVLHGPGTKSDSVRR